MCRTGGKSSKRRWVSAVDGAPGRRYTIAGMQVTAPRSGWPAALLAVVIVLSSLLVRAGGAATWPSNAASAAGSYDWLQFDGDAQHDGNNQLETTISAGNVSTLAQLFRISLP